MDSPRPFFALIGAIGIVFFAACTVEKAKPSRALPAFPPEAGRWTAEESVGRDPYWSNRVATTLDRYRGRIPRRFAEFHPTTFRRLETASNVVALTFDACGGKYGSGFNAPLVDFLEAERVPATIFVSWRWVTNGNLGNFRRLATNGLFQVENHGLTHRPCAVSPREIYRIPSTPDLAAAVMEIAGNAALLERLTGRRTSFFRSGTAYYDDVAMDLAASLGHRVAGWDVLSGDVGGGQTAQAIAGRVLRVCKPGSVVIMHLNQPSWNAAPATRIIVETLRSRGVRFVRLDGEGEGP